MRLLEWFSKTVEILNAMMKNMGNSIFFKSQKNQSWLREAKLGEILTQKNPPQAQPLPSLNLASEENQDIDLVTSSSSQKVRWKVSLAQKKVMLLSSRRVSISGLWKLSRSFFNAGWVRRLLFPYPWHWRVIKTKVSNFGHLFSYMKKASSL